MAAWETKPLAEVCTIKPPKAEARAKLAGSDEVSFVPMEDLGIGVKYVAPTRARQLNEVAGSYTYFADGDVLLAKITPCFENGKLGVARGLVNGVGFGSSEYVVLRPGPELDAEFLYYFLSRPSFRENGARTMTGAVGHKRVTKEFVAECRIPMAPLSEQQRIVVVLDEACEAAVTAKANAETNLRNAAGLYESALDIALSLHNGGYIDTTLGAEVDLLAGYAFSSKGYTAVDDGVRLLRGDNIMQGYLRWEDAKGWPADDVEPYARFALKDGDVVLAMDRPWVKAGLKRAQIGPSDLPCLLLQRTSRLRPGTRLRVDFLFHLVGSRMFSRHLLGVQTGIGVPHISGKQIESFQFMLPPLVEQEAIAGRLDELQQSTERLVAIYEQKAAALDELKTSLLRHAFNGDL